MKLNGVLINIPAYTEESLDNEMILYIDEFRKIIVLNQSALTIWECILKYYNNNENLNTNEIANELIKRYKESAPELETLVNDIEETIEMLINSSLIIECIEGC